MKNALTLFALTMLISSESYAAKLLVCWDSAYPAGPRVAFYGTLSSDTEIAELTYYDQKIAGPIEGVPHEEAGLCAGRNDFALAGTENQQGEPLLLSLPRGVTRMWRSFYVTVYGPGVECEKSPLLRCRVH